MNKKRIGLGIIIILFILGIVYLKEIRSERIPVLLYHHLLPEKDIKSENPSVISEENFESQMKWLHDNNYHTATMKELEQHLKGEIKLPENTVVITFDDGYLSNVVYGYPILKKYNQKATIFMIGDVADKPQEEYSPIGLQFISASTIEEYKDVFYFGCHTYSMHKKDGESYRLTSYDDEEIIEDLLKNKELFNSKYIAYPHGQYNENTIEILKQLGFELGFAAKHGYVKKNTELFEIPRVIIYPTTSLKKFVRIIK